MKKNDIFSYLLTLMFFISMSIFLFSTLYSPLKEESLNDLNLKKSDYEDLKKEVSRIKNDYKSWLNIKDEYKKGKSEYIMKFKDLSKLRTDLKSSFYRLGLKENGFKIEYRKIMKGEFRKAVINFQLSGSYKNIKKLIFELNNLKKFLLLQKVRLKKKEKGQLTVIFYLGVYLVP